VSGGIDFQTIYESLKAAQTMATALISAETAFDKAELKFKVADLVSKLIETKTQVSDMQDALDRMADELDETKTLLKFSGQMKFKRPFYWNVAEGASDGPYCPTCWDSKKSAIRLQQGQSDRCHWRCNVCKFADRDGAVPPSPDQRK
jgi:hypothetical protein